MVLSQKIADLANAIGGALAVTNAMLTSLAQQVGQIASVVANPQIPVVTTFPANPNLGTIVANFDQGGDVYYYDGVDWLSLATHHVAFSQNNSPPPYTLSIDNLGATDETLDGHVFPYPIRLTQFTSSTRFNEIGQLQILSGSQTVASLTVNNENFATAELSVTIPAGQRFIVVATSTSSGGWTRHLVKVEYKRIGV